MGRRRGASRRSSREQGVAVAALALVVACGGADRTGRAVVVAPASPPPSAAASAPLAAPSAAEASSAPAPVTLSRAAVRAAIAQGLGAFLQHVELDDRPVLVGGKFHGFRIVALRDAAFWAGIDLRPGDVVTAVNGFPIERPEQAGTVFDSLDVASDLRVAYDRDGKAREIVFAIVDGR